MLTELRKDIKKFATPARAKANMWFFKTGEGEYGYGDQFVGLSVPLCRELAKKYKDLSLDDTTTILHSPIHEERMIALFILVSMYKKGDIEKRTEIYEYYLANTQYVNNWDLVDSSAHKIVGDMCWSMGSILVLEKLAESKSMWERRIAMIATAAYISRSEYDATFSIAEILIHDKHDLIQKAVGWMLREVGKKCGQGTEEKFLKLHYKEMGRTALRYAIEKFPEQQRKEYLLGKI